MPTTLRDMVLQTFTAVNRPSAINGLKVQLFAGLRKPHYTALRQSTAAAARAALKRDGLESDESLRIFGRLRDEQPDALMVATGLSHEQAVEVRDYHIGTIKRRVLEAWRELSRMKREASGATDQIGRAR